MARQLPIEAEAGNRIADSPLINLIQLRAGLSASNQITGYL